MQRDDDQWICPSFNSYSQNKSAETAAKVAGEATGEGAGDVQLPSIAENDDQKLNEEDDFEFSLILNDEFELSGEEIITNFPIFNRELLNDFESKNEKNHSEKKVDIATVKVPLSRLFLEERENQEPASPSSSSEEEGEGEAEEGDEVESIPPGSYCVWKPKVAAPSPSTCKKSKSTGFGSTRWKLRDLLRRSNSEGKDSFVFLTPKKNEHKKNSNKKSVSGPASSLGSGSSSSSGTVISSPTRRMVYSPANRDIVGGNGTPNRSPKGNGEMPKRRSYLPYRQDLVGFFTTVNSIGRNFSPL